MPHALRLGFLVLGLAAMGCASSAPPAAVGWAKLGERTVNHAVDHDEIRVGPRDGDFRQIKLLVRQRAVTFRDVKVHFANGTVQDVQLRREVPAGGETRAIDLRGDDRVISKVVFFYNTAPRRGRRAVVQLYGRR